MIQYDHESIEHGCLLAQWWSILHQTGDIEKIFPIRARSLQSLCKLMEPPMELYWEVDDKGVWLSAWLSPSLDGAFFSLWVREDMRKKRVSWESVVRLYDYGLEKYPLLMGVTIQPDLLRVHQLGGYNILGIIPHAFDGKDAWFITMTRESYKRDALIEKGEEYD